MKTWLNRSVSVLALGSCLFVLFVAYGLLDNRWYHVLAVNGSSMEPAIDRGDCLVITPPPAGLEPGMVVTMDVGGQLVTHRVVGVDPLVTKGDANAAVDRWGASQVRIVGLVRFRIPGLGLAIDRMRRAAEHIARGTVEDDAWPGSPAPKPSPAPAPAGPARPADGVSGP